MAKQISGSRPKRKIRPKPEPKPSSDSGSLQGWNAIAKFLGQTPAVAQRGTNPECQSRTAAGECLRRRKS